MGLASHIEYTQLRPDILWSEVENMCRKSIENGFPALCIPPWMIKQARAALAESEVKVASVASYPNGFGMKISKWTETLQISGEGAHEIGIPVNISQLKSGDMDGLRSELLGLGLQSNEKDYVLKIIVETSLLDFAELDIICGLIVQAPPKFVQISTVFSEVGPDLEKVEHLRDMLPPEIKLKVAGKQFSYENAVKLLEMGVDRIGTPTIITEP